MKRINLPVPKLVRQYHAGADTYALGLTYGVSQTTIWDRLHRAGTEMRPQKFQPGSRHNVGNAHARKLGGPFYTHKNRYLRSRDRAGKRCFIHRACWEAHHGPIPTGRVIHHVNADTLDNAIENLVSMGRCEHARLSAGKKV